MPYEIEVAEGRGGIGRDGFFRGVRTFTAGSGGVVLLAHHPQHGESGQQQDHQGEHDLSKLRHDAAEDGPPPRLPAMGKCDRLWIGRDSAFAISRPVVSTA